jgi:hypothetical protein
MKPLFRMGFSDDQPTVMEQRSKLKPVVLSISIGLFLLSLLNNGYCMDNSCRSSIELLLMGGIAMLTGGAAIAWLASPLLVVSWMLLARNKKAAWLFALAALISCLYFLHFKVVIDDEAGNYRTITKIGWGYWLWLASCATTCIGSLTLRIFSIAQRRP